MKERILMTVIGLVIILVLSWAVTAVASSYNAKIPSTAVITPDYGRISVEDTAKNKVKLDESRTKRADFSRLPKADTNK